MRSCEPPCGRPSWPYTMQPRRGTPHGEVDLGSAGTETVDFSSFLLFSKNLNSFSFTFFKRKKQARDNLSSLSRVWPYPTASGCHDNDPLNLSQFPRELVYQEVQLPSQHSHASVVSILSQTQAGHKHHPHSHRHLLHVVLREGLEPGLHLYSEWCLLI